VREAADEPVAHGIGRHRHDDRDGLRRLPGREHRGRGEGDDDLGLHARQLNGERGHALELAFAPAYLQAVILAFDVALLAHALAERFQPEVGVVLGHDGGQKADDVDFLLLREHTE